MKLFFVHKPCSLPIYQKRASHRCDIMLKKSHWSVSGIPEWFLSGLLPTGKVQRNSETERGGRPQGILVSPSSKVRVKAVSVAPGMCAIMLSVCPGTPSPPPLCCHSRNSETFSLSTAVSKLLTTGLSASFAHRQR